MKKIAILGSTGSIGQNALSVVREFPDEFRVVALSANRNVTLLARQIREFHPSLVYVNDAQDASRLKAAMANRRIKFLTQDKGLEQLIQDEAVEVVVLAISGSAALAPLLKAIACGKQVALANKEALVMAGPFIMEQVAEFHASLIPIDSEESAIWQCLQGQDRAQLRHIYLTASGGPFRKTPGGRLATVSVHQVLRHPRWKMGRKISVDSATLMNKGFELLEAMYLFKVKPQQVRILIHPEAIIHSMVEFADGAVMAQLSVTDMRIPIQYALSYPKRFANNMPAIDFFKLRSLTFEEPDLDRFPCLGLAQRVAEQGGTLPAVLNAADEVCVESFLKGKLKFIAIPKVIEKVLRRHRNRLRPGLPDILEADAWARTEAQRVIKHLSRKRGI